MRSYSSRTRLGQTRVMQSRRLVTAKLLISDPLKGEREIDCFVCPHCQVSRPIQLAGVYCGPCNRLTCRRPACTKECNSVLRKYDSLGLL